VKQAPKNAAAAPSAAKRGLFISGCSDFVEALRNPAVKMKTC